ncbi:MAG TPA: ribonuclease E inhibitor RraB [Gillisia sp.]|nr:ribonuclease E inhibitor RraB [Gillisia sp.]
MNYLNRIVIGLFKCLGGNMTKKHPVTHWFYFQNPKDLLKFEDHMNQIGFSTIQKNLKRKTPKEKLLLIVGKTEKINEDSINFDTEEFRKITIQYHGEYDGWETQIE